MNGITIHEFDILVAEKADGKNSLGLKTVPSKVFNWLQLECLKATEQPGPNWLRLRQKNGQLAVQVLSFVGVVRAVDGFQIEVLPKVGKTIDGGDVEVRKLLIKMLRCLGGFRHIQTENAILLAARMPLLEVFIAEFLQSVGHVVKRGIRGDYVGCQENLFKLRGKLQFSQHLRHNLCRADRFFTAHDEFTSNRPENRLLHTALRCVLTFSASQENQQLARELRFAFSDVPESGQIAQDFQQVRLDRGMSHYADALAWTKLILNEASPLTGTGSHRAPSLLFPMEAVFESYVSKHLARQLVKPFSLKSQASSHALVMHEGKNWFRLKPDLLVRHGSVDHLVLDTKWKLVTGALSNGTDKYGLSQADFYQLHAYGQTYLNGRGDVILIYPKTEKFSEPLSVFEFPKSSELRLWVLPFCLHERVLLFPKCSTLDGFFESVKRLT